MAQRVLVVDDEQPIADLVEVYLKNEGFAVTKCYDGATALQRIEEGPFDLAVLDVMLPDTSGFSLCQKIREQYNYPVLLLTAREGELDKINGLALGADDYVTKPFRPLELIARVKAQLRRYTKYNPAEAARAEETLAFRGLTLDRATHECTLDGRIVPLTPTEFSILWILAENRGRVVSSEELFRQAWGEKYFRNENNTVMVHIRHLREKLGEGAENPRYIRTVWGVGYKIEA